MDGFLNILFTYRLRSILPLLKLIIKRLEEENHPQPRLPYGQRSRDPEKRPFRVQKSKKAAIHKKCSITKVYFSCL